MSMGREMYYESIADEAYYYHVAERALANGIWITRNGREIPVREMTDAHLANSLRMMRRGGSGCFHGLRDEAVEMLAAEAAKRGLTDEVKR